MLALCFMAGLTIAACGSTSAENTTHHRSSARRPETVPLRTVRAQHPRPVVVAPSYPRLLSAATDSAPMNFAPAVTWRGQTAAWIARRPNVALLSFNQRLVTLRLHSGTIDAGSTGWRFGPTIAGTEWRRLVAAFNGAFKLDTDSGGFEAYGRVAVSLTDGFGSIVTYSDGSTDIGSWHRGVPAPGKPVVSVRQNLRLLIDQGRPAASLGCLTCWGATLGGVPDPARSALGITADGHLIWAGGEHLTVPALTGDLLAARVARAVELDINPEWVAGYLYNHHRGRGPLAPVPVVAGQPGVPGQFLEPYSRDFFAIVTR
jgi:hypothetical protein